MFSAAGFRGLEAYNVDGAEAVVREYPGEITLLLTDVDMQGSRNGLDLAWMAERWLEIGIPVASGLFSLEQGLMPDGALFCANHFRPR